MSELDQTVTFLPISVTVLRQRRGHGRPERCERSSCPATTSTGLVSRVGVYDCFPALLGNVSLFSHCPVQRAASQKEPEEDQMNVAKS